MLWWHSKTWLYALTYTKTRSSHTNAFNAKLYDFFLKWILEGLSIGLVSRRSWKIEIALISQTSSLNWKLTQMSSTFPQVFNLKLRKYVVHTLLINRYASSPHPVVSRKIDWQIEIKKFVKSVKKRGQTHSFFLDCALQNDISVSPRSLFFIAKVEDSFLPIQGFTIFCCAKWFWCQIYTLSTMPPKKNSLCAQRSSPSRFRFAISLADNKTEIGSGSSLLFRIWTQTAASTNLLFVRRDKNHQASRLILYAKVSLKVYNLVLNSSPVYFKMHSDPDKNWETFLRSKYDKVFLP